MRLPIGDTAVAGQGIADGFVQRQGARRSTTPRRWSDASASASSGCSSRWLRWWVQPPQQFDALHALDAVLHAVRDALREAGIDIPFPTRQVLFHDQTEEADGDRARQREGWPAAAPE